MMNKGRQFFFFKKKKKKKPYKGYVLYSLSIITFMSFRADEFSVV
jgi:hypothetical protein